MRIFLAGAALAVGLGLAAFASTEGDAAKVEFDAERMLSAAALRDAIRGDEFSFRGVPRVGDSAISFAQGYITAMAAVAERDKAWCDSGIMPHEVVARVFDHIVGLGDEAAKVAADAAVLDTLHELAPCKENEVSQ